MKRSNRGTNNNYLGNILETISTLWKGMQVTWRHIWNARKDRKPHAIYNNAYFEQKEGIVTLQYPHESIPVPDNGRYLLHNEIDDCIVCDKCAKICPVDCIDIEPIKATETLGKTSSGATKRIHAAKFDIDMAKCCFCGLCTVVCPTESLTMTKTYDFSEYDVKNHNYVFAEMTPLEILTAKQKLDEANKQKQSYSTSKTTPSRPKPAFKPRMTPRSNPKKPPNL